MEGFSINIDLNVNELSLVTAAVHFLKHHPLCDGDDNPLRKKLDNVQQMIYDKVPDEEPINAGEWDDDVRQLVALATDCTYAKIVFDTHTTIREMAQRHALWALGRVFEEVTEAELEEKMLSDDLPPQ